MRQAAAIESRPALRNLFLRCAMFLVAAALSARDRAVIQLNATVAMSASLQKSGRRCFQNRVTDCCPVASRDGHDLPRLVDECVPSVAAMVDDIVEGFEVPLFERGKLRPCL
jgi:hypothetical protein